MAGSSSSYIDSIVGVRCGNISELKAEIHSEGARAENKLGAHSEWGKGVY
jgi:hypothetical protein